MINQKGGIHCLLFLNSKSMSKKSEMSGRERILIHLLEGKSITKMKAYQTKFKRIWDLQSAIKDLKRHGYPIIGTHKNSGGKNYKAYSIPKPLLDISNALYGFHVENRTQRSFWPSNTLIMNDVQCQFEKYRVQEELLKKKV